MLSSTLVERVIRQQGNRIFSVLFVKRSDGTLRRMNCRRKVVAYLQGGDPAYDRPARNLVCVFDLKKGAYRSIPTDSVIEIHAKGKVYRKETR